MRGYLLTSGFAPKPLLTCAVPSLVGLHHHRSVPIVPRPSRGPGTCKNPGVTQFESRFDLARYRNDPVVGVVATSTQAEAWIPERLYRRLFLLGNAYELHYLGLLPGDSEPAYLSATQARGLVDELEFLLRVANDELLTPCIGDIIEVATVAARGTHEPALRVGGQ